MKWLSVDVAVKEFKYRLDIQAVRGIAVLLVVLNHLKVPGFEFGYLGVDVFFVISGFVISGLIFGNVSKGHWSLKEYYLRRAMRLLPSLYVVLFAIYALALLSPDSFRVSVLKEIPFAALGVSNINFFLSSGYFDNESILRPTLHTWSLSVEEQFYLIFAPIMAFAIKRNSHVPVLLAMVALSCVASVALLGVENAAFYLLPFRALELLAGVGIFFFTREYSLNSSLTGFVGFFGVATLILMVPLFSFLMPGMLLAAAISTVATMAVLAAPDVNLVGALSRSWGLQWLGAISYSLYLVHWPIISFLAINNIPVHGVISTAFVFIASLVVAQALYFFVEKRFHIKMSDEVGRRGLVLGVGVVAVLLSSLSSLVYFSSVHSGSFYQRFFKENYTERFSAGRYGKCFIDASGHQEFNSSECLSKSYSKPNLLIIGDSHAAYLSPGIISEFSKYNVMQSTAVACPPLVGLPAGKVSENCAERNADGFEFIKNNNLDLIVVYAKWDFYDSSSLGATMKYMKDVNPGARIVLVVGAPNYKKQLARILFDSRTIEEAKAEADANTPYNDAGYFDGMRALAGEAGVELVVIPDLLCKNGSCDIVTENLTPIIFDYGHFTKEGASYFAARMHDDLARRNIAW